MTNLQGAAFDEAMRYAVERNAREHHELREALTEALTRATDNIEAGK